MYPPGASPSVDIAVTEEDLVKLFGDNCAADALDPIDAIILFRRDIPGYTNYAHVNFTSREAALLARSK